MDSGAINKQTLQYVLPDKATKSYKYKCPDCNKDLILCKGEIRKAYFRHKVDKKDPCTYYTNPSETQIHKDAKLRLKELIKTKILKLNRYCCNCKNTKQHCISEICEKSEICIEHRFRYNGSNKFADVAFLKDGNIEQIYEICQTHKTKEKDRPEPWFEFNAVDIIELSKKEDNDLEINCIRDKYCDECIYMEDLKINDLEKWIRIKLGQDYDNPKYTGSPIGGIFLQDSDDSDSDDNNPTTYEEIILTEEEYNKLDNEQKGNFKINHKRFNFDAQCVTEYINHNKDICDIFSDYLNTNRIVIYSYKGTVYGYIISNKDYREDNDFRIRESNYWEENYISDGLSGCLELPYIYKKEYCGYGTVDILKDLIVNSLKNTPKNECKYANSKPELSDENYFYACNNTGTSYWSDGVYGPCMECNRGDEI